MNASQKNSFGKFGLFATRVGIVACIIQLANLWVPVLLDTPTEAPITFIKTSSGTFNKV